MAPSDAGRRIAQQVAAGLKKIANLSSNEQYELNEYLQKASGSEANSLRDKISRLR
jgi:hypothetical protein